MSNIKEQIRKLRGLAEGYARCQLWNVADNFKEAADTIESLYAKLQSANMERSTAYYNGGWIPCGERLPECNGEYICTQENHSLSSGKVVSKSVEMVEFCNGAWRRAKHLKIIAWQPKPEVYKE